jgi:hypothetical protein
LSPDDQLNLYAGPLARDATRGSASFPFAPVTASRARNHNLALAAERFPQSG